MTKTEEALLQAFADAIVETVDGEEVLTLITPALNAIRSEAWEVGRRDGNRPIKAPNPYGPTS